NAALSRGARRDLGRRSALRFLTRSYAGSAWYAPSDVFGSFLRRFIRRSRLARTILSLLPTSCANFSEQARCADQRASARRSELVGLSPFAALLLLEVPEDGARIDPQVARRLGAVA